MRNFQKNIDRIISKLNECVEELKQCNEEIEKLQTEILDKEEKEYLSAVIKPFRNRVKFIRKTSLVTSKIEYLGILIEGITKEDERIYLPDFKPNTMYKGMEPDKEYTLEELGL